jgi:hypothetical protein
MQTLGAAQTRKLFEKSLIKNFTNSFIDKAVPALTTQYQVLYQFVRGLFWFFFLLKKKERPCPCPYPPVPAQDHIHRDGRDGT